jgi:hypothetical protein
MAGLTGKVQVTPFPRGPDPHALTSWIYARASRRQLVPSGLRSDPMPVVWQMDSRPEMYMARLAGETLEPITRKGLRDRADGWRSRPMTPWSCRLVSHATRKVDCERYFSAEDSKQCRGGACPWPAWDAWRRRARHQYTAYQRWASRRRPRCSSTMRCSGGEESHPAARGTRFSYVRPC